jgi:hypothetical protein
MILFCLLPGRSRASDNMTNRWLLPSGLDIKKRTVKPSFYSVRIFKKRIESPQMWYYTSTSLKGSLSLPGIDVEQPTLRTCVTSAYHDKQSVCVVARLSKDRWQCLDHLRKGDRVQSDRNIRCLSMIFLKQLPKFAGNRAHISKKKNIWLKKGCIGEKCVKMHQKIYQIWKDCQTKMSFWEFKLSCDEDEWDIALFSHFEVDRCFRGAYCLHHQGDEWLSGFRENWNTYGTPTRANWHVLWVVFTNAGRFKNRRINKLTTNT